MNYKKIALFTILGIGATYGGYKLVKYINRNKGGNDIPVDENNVISGTTTNPSAPKFDNNKVVKKGSKGGEVKTIQTAFNNIIDDAKKVNVLTLKTDYNPAEPKGILDDFMNKLGASNELDKLSDKTRRITTIQKLNKLNVDGDFGSKTESVCQVIMGKKEVSYSEVKQKRIDFAKVYGLPSPY